MKTLSKILLAALVLIALSNQSKAQKMEKPKVDKFTGATSVSTTLERIYATASPVATGVNVAVKKIDDSYVLVVNIIIVNGEAFYSIAKDDKLSLKLADNTVMNLPAAFATTSVEKLIGTNRRSEAIIYYSLSKDDMTKLTASNVTAVRVATSKGDFDYDVTDKYADLIKKEIALFKN
jgi:hypothetical protein